MKIINADILTAFQPQAIGTKVIHPVHFINFLTSAIESFDFTAQRTPGQGLVTLPQEAFSTVSCGQGRRTTNPDDYVIRLYRGNVGLYLKREHAAETNSLSAVVYTADAYLNDPDVNCAEGMDEITRVVLSKATHVLVSVLAAPYAKATYGYSRFVKNLAGGNLDFSSDRMTYEDVVNLAKEEVGHNDRWITVAD